MRDSALVKPSSVLITPRLYRRKPRPADLPAELAAYRELSSIMAVDPGRAIQRFLDLAVELCPAAGSGGLSELVERPEGELFEWTAMSGEFAGYVGGTTPRDFSPCGLCLDRHHTILVQQPSRVFAYLQEAEPAIWEGLIVPLYDTGKKPMGTLWITSHSEGQRFDPTDVRVIEQLAVQLVLAIKLRRKAEIRAALEDAVHDRDVLVEEVRHRVKNMVQMTTSLLSMQEKAASSDEARVALRDAQNRLSVLSGVYETLIVPKGDGLTVELPGLVRSLVSALVRNTHNAGKLKVEVDCADISLDVTAATSLGMILNEAVTNALKYAFAHRGSGELRVQLACEGSACSLLISDDGPGFVHPPRDGSLGMRLMRGLARQLDGQLAIDGSAGTTVSFRWTLKTASLQPVVTKALLANI